VLNDGIISKAFVTHRGATAWDPAAASTIAAAPLAAIGVAASIVVGLIGAALCGAGVYRGGYGGWARPSWYRWGAGSTVCGAAIGVLATGAASPTRASRQRELCWYYTDPSYRNGFWDAC
jgi:hypothetical protein